LDSLGPKSSPKRAALGAKALHSGQAGRGRAQCCAATRAAAVAALLHGITGRGKPHSY
jgi:hypothetical protein